MSHLEAKFSNGSPKIQVSEKCINIFFVSACSADSSFALMISITAAVYLLAGKDSPANRLSDAKRKSVDIISLHRLQCLLLGQRADVSQLAELVTGSLAAENDATSSFSTTSTTIAFDGNKWSFWHFCL